MSFNGTKTYRSHTSFMGLDRPIGHLQGHKPCLLHCDWQTIRPHLLLWDWDRDAKPPLGRLRNKGHTFSGTEAEATHLLQGLTGNRTKTFFTEIDRPRGTGVEVHRTGTEAKLFWDWDTESTPPYLGLGRSHTFLFGTEAEATPLSLWLRQKLLLLQKC